MKCVIAIAVCAVSLAACAPGARMVIPSDCVSEALMCAVTFGRRQIVETTPAGVKFAPGYPVRLIQGPTDTPHIGHMEAQALIDGEWYTLHRTGDGVAATREHDWWYTPEKAVSVWTGLMNTEVMPPEKHHLGMLSAHGKTRSNTAPYTPAQRERSRTRRPELGVHYPFGHENDPSGDRNDTAPGEHPAR